MKKFVLILLVFCLFQNIASAQESVKDRTAKVVAKFETTATVSKETANALKSIFSTYYTGIEKLREELKPGKAQGEDAYKKAKNQKDLLVRNRDEQLKKVLTPEQYKKWLSEIQPSLKPE